MLKFSDKKIGKKNRKMFLFKKFFQFRNTLFYSDYAILGNINALRLILSYPERTYILYVHMLDGAQTVAIYKRLFTARSE